MRESARPCTRCRDPLGEHSAHPHARGCRAVRHRWIAAAVAVPLLIVGAFAEDHREKTAWDHRNRDPRQGVVWLKPDRSQWKVCDGSTLVYHSEVRGGEDIEPREDSPECAP